MLLYESNFLILKFMTDDKRKPGEELEGVTEGDSLKSSLESSALEQVMEVVKETRPGLEVVTDLQETEEEQGADEDVTMDIDYFQNPTNVMADMYCIAMALNPEAEGLESLLVLDSLHKISKLVMSCSNGEKVSGRTYLARAAMAFGFAKNAREGLIRQSETLEYLKKICELSEEEKTEEEK